MSFIYSRACFCFILNCISIYRWLLYSCINIVFMHAVTDCSFVQICWFWFCRKRDLDLQANWQEPRQGHISGSELAWLAPDRRWEWGDESTADEREKNKEANGSHHSTVCEWLAFFTCRKHRSEIWLCLEILILITYQNAVVPAIRA